MKKIPSLFRRDHAGDRTVFDEIVPGCEWVQAGEGVATVKWDGTCCLVDGGRLFKRRTLRRGKTPPPGYVAATATDEVTGKQEGWVPVGDGPDDAYHREAWSDGLPDGTYELVGPKVQGGAEGDGEQHELWRHGSKILAAVPTDFVGLADFLDGGGIEGIVWHHPDGRMCKIKARDFGVSREEK